MTTPLRFTILSAMLIATLAAKAFTVTVGIDNADAVTIEADGSTVQHTAGSNTVTAQSMIKVTPIEGYAITRADDITSGQSLLNYDVQTTAVTIRPYTSTGMGEAVDNDGHEYTIETIRLADLDNYSLAVYVDDASQVVLSVGPTSDTYSSQNRVITLIDGDNDVTYTSADKYVHITTARWGDKIYEVSFNGHNLPEYGGYYSYPLSATGGELKILYNNPDVVHDGCSMTVTIDAVENMKYFSNDTAVREHIGQLADGDNTIVFTEGDTFSIWSYTDPVEVTLDGQPLQQILGMFYSFSPADGSHVKVTYNASSIAGISTDDAPRGVIYNLQGIPVDAARLTPGTYIANGRKFLVK